MKLTGLKGRLGFLAALACLVLLIAGTVYYVFDYGVPSPFVPNLKPHAQMQPIAEASPESYMDNLWLLSRVIQGEAGDQPYDGKVAVGAVLLNRMQSSAFPHSLSGVVFQPYAFESVANGFIWMDQPALDSIRAATAALSGWDPAFGALYFWNPSKPVNSWIWTRQILTQIGQHVFAR